MPHEFQKLSRRFHERSVLQVPGAPNRIRHFEIGGPDDPADRRLQLDTKTLEHMLKIARSSPVGVCVIHQVGLEISVWEKDGHRYEQVTMIGLQPKPKRVDMNIQLGSDRRPIRNFKGGE